MTDTGHAIVGGLGHLGERIAALLRERGCTVVAIEQVVDDALRQRMEALGCRLVPGDVRDDHALELAGIATAHFVFLVTGDDLANLEAAIDARTCNPTASIVLRLFDQSLARCVEGAFGIHALSASFISSPAFVSAATEESIVAMFNIDGCHLGVYQRLVDDDAPISPSVRVAKAGLALRLDDSGPLCLTLPQHRHPRHAAHTGRRRVCFRALFDWHPRHLLREFAAAWRHAAGITRGLLIALGAMMLLSVLVFTGFGNMTSLDAIYFVVTTMTTIGYGDLNLLNAPPLLKVYGIMMMLGGAALLATVYALIADYVLTARVEYLLGRREVRLRDHTVVIGLGNVGYRVARDLALLGVTVVAVEANEDSDNVSAARAQFPVVIGNAARASVLHKAGVDHAAVLLALTDDPMLNLSVAMHAREHTPGIKAVVRTYDVGLARKFSTFGLDNVLSTSAIAAPVFVDVALHPGVHGSFIYDGDDILVAHLAVDASAALRGQRIAAIGDTLGIAVVLVADASTDYRLATPDAILRPGQRIVALLTRDKLPQLQASAPRT